MARLIGLLWLALWLALAPAAGHPAAGPALGSGVAFAPDGALWWVGLDEAGRLVLRTSHDLGRQWSAPRVLAADARISADGENRPKIAFGPAGTAAAQVVVVSYTQPLDKPYTGAIRLLRSTDGGAHFAPPATVHADRQLITHRFDSLLFDEVGRLHVAWIDKRDLEAARAAGRAYRGAAVYRAVSTDGGASFGPDTRLADHSCECCRIALAPAPGGGVAALWRHVFAPNERDHAFALWRDGEAPSAEQVRATEDRWALDACPHHGPGLAPAADGGWHAVWCGVRTEAGRQEAGVRVGMLDAGGRTVGPVRRLPDAAAEHADIGAAGQRVVVVWRSFDGQRTLLRAWVSADGGQRFTLRELDASAADNDHPRLLRQGGRFFVFWRTVEGARVHEIPAT